MEEISGGNNEVSGADPAKVKPGDDFLVVGLGASAGGIVALKEFFAHVPADSGMAYVVILHLSPEHESHLAEVLQSAAAIPITQVTDRVRVVPNHVYVIPPNRSLAMADGHLALSKVTRIEERRAPVDIFFRTLAQSRMAHAVSVILSGTGADGSMGMKRVKEMGGICIVQEPNEAEYSDMPRHSIATGLVDYALPVAEIPAKIIAYKERLSTVNIPVDSEERGETDERALRDIFTQLRVRTGHDFFNYKRATVLRRLERRISVHELADLTAYAQFMREHSEESVALLRDLLISVTNFFRDRGAFEALERNIIPKLFEGKGANDQVRVWVAGCATGEEAYSVAMLLCGYAANLINAPKVQVFATDIDEQAIAAAREGYYTLNDAADVSPEQLHQFFIKEQDGYRVRRELRETVLFANHNLIKDPPFSHLDLATCRNLLIYLNRTAQERVIEVFHFALNPGGYLFLGNSESINGAGDRYLTIDNDQHIFQSRAALARTVLPVADLPLTTMRADLRPKEERAQEARAVERISYADIHQRLLEQYAPPSVIVNEEHEVVHLSERAGRYMQISGGEPSHNLLNIVRPELRLELRTALYQAVQKNTNVEARGLQVRIDERVHLVNLKVRPVLREDDEKRGFLLVLFEETREATEAERAHADDAISVVAVEPVARQLEDELVRAKAQLRSTVEQYEVQHEELKASNEELQAINEELRSAAEELETSKEELQSVNEELLTVNQELKVKIEELSQSNNDFQNLMNSTKIGTVFLDRALRVKLFTPSARNIINLLPSDVGRPLSDITNQFLEKDLLNDIESVVLERLQIVEREIKTSDERWFLLRALPYRTSEDQISGVVLTFLDITERRQREEEVSRLARRLEQQSRIFSTALASISDFVYIFDRDGRFVYSNQPLLDLLGVTAEEIAGKNFFDLNYPEDLAARLQKQIQKVFDTGEIVRDDTPFTTAAGKPGFYEYIFTPVFAPDGTVESVAGSTRDVTTRKLIENKLRESREQLQRATKAGRIFSWELDLETREFSFSENMKAVLGFNLPARIIQNPFESNMHPEDVELAMQKILRAVETGEPHENTMRFVNPQTGEIIWLHSQGGTVTTAEGRNVFAGVAQNITERKRAEAALRESEEKFRRFVTVTSDVVYQISADWRELRSLDGKEFIHSTNEANKDWLEEYIPETDRRLVSDAFEKAIQTKSIYELEHRVNRLDGLIGWAFSRAIPVLDEAGEIVEWLGAASDVTERKRAEELLRESEERLRLTMESVTDYAILTMDTAGRIKSWNAGAERIFEYTEEEVIGQSTELIFTPEDRAAGAPEAEMKGAREDGRAADERWHIRKNGRRFYMSGVLSPLYDGDDNLTGYAKIARDLTEQQHAEEALRRAHEDLEHKVEERTLDLAKANESLRAENAERRRIEKARLQLLRQLVRVQDDERRRIARDIHDHLGQQSTALRLKLEVLKGACKKYKELCAPISQAQEIAASLDSDVDFLAWELRPAALDDVGLAAALGNFVKEWSKHFGIPSDFHSTGMDADRPSPEIETNLYRIAQEALNNTCKHAQASRVDVLLERRDHSIVLIIEDDGVGFDTEQTITETDRGLGLLGMRERAALIGGTLEIEASPNQGTTVYARLPVTFPEEGLAEA